MEKAKEYARLKKILITAGVQENKLKAADGLVNEAAALREIMERLRGEIDNQVITGEYANGKQTYIKINPALKTYNTCLGNYTKVIGALIRLLPDKERGTSDIMDYLTGVK